MAMAKGEAEMAGVAMGAAVQAAVMMAVAMGEAAMAEAATGFACPIWCSIYARLWVRGLCMWGPPRKMWLIQPQV